MYKNFTTGDRVKVSEFEGTVRDPYAHDGCVKVRDNDGYNHYVFPLSDAVKVEKQPDPDPAYWPPKQGEIWRVGLTEYAVYRYGLNHSFSYGYRVDDSAYNVIQPLNTSHDYSTTYFTDKTGSLFSYKSFDDFKALKPRRVRAALSS
jgi:hypothetical protein